MLKRKQKIYTLTILLLFHIGITFGFFYFRKRLNICWRGCVELNHSGWQTKRILPLLPKGFRKQLSVLLHTTWGRFPQATIPLKEWHCYLTGHFRWNTSSPSVMMVMTWQWWWVVEHYSSLNSLFRSHLRRLSIFSDKRYSSCITIALSFSSCSSL